MEHYEENIISIKVRPDLKVFKNFCLSNFFSNNGTRSIIIIGILAIIADINLITNILSKNGEIPLYLIAIPGGFILYMAMVPFLTNNIATKIFRQKIYQEDQSFQISKDEVEIRTESSFIKVKISDLYEVIETKKIFVLFLSVTIDKVFIVPKECFEKEVEIELFKRFIRGSLPKNKVKLL